MSMGGKILSQFKKIPRHEPRNMHGDQCGADKTWCARRAGRRAAARPSPSARHRARVLGELGKDVFIPAKKVRGRRSFPLITIASRGASMQQHKTIIVIIRGVSSHPSPARRVVLRRITAQSNHRHHQGRFLSSPAARLWCFDANTQTAQMQ